MSNSKARERLEKRLALGMALVNGANTFAPMALLYARPDQVLGRQQALPDWQQPVAARVSASADRKPYSATNLQSLAYAAMSAADASVFGTAEAASTYIVPAGSTSTVDTLSGGDVMSVSGASGNPAIGSVVIANGAQYVYAYGVGNVITMNAGGWQNVKSGGTGNVTTMSGGEQTVNKSGSGTVTTMNNGTQVINFGGNGMVDTMSGGTQNVNGGTGTVSALNGGTQVISAGGLASATNISAGGTQQVLSGGIANSTTLTKGGVLDLYQGYNLLNFNGGADVATLGSSLNGGTEILNAGLSISNTTIDNGGIVLRGDSVSAATATSVTLSSAAAGSSGTQIVSAYGVASGTIINAGGMQDVESGGLASATIISGGIQNISSGGKAEADTLNAGQQIIYAGGIGNLTSQAGGTQIVSGGTGTVDYAWYGKQYISGGTGSVTSAHYINQFINGGTGLIGTLEGGGQYISAGTGSIGTIISCVQDISSGATGSIGIMSDGLQNGAGTGSIGTMLGGKQNTLAGASIATMSGGVQNVCITGSIGTMAGGVQWIYGGGTGSVTTLNGGTQYILDGTGQVATQNGGTQLVEDNANGSVTNMNGGTQNISSGGTGLATNIALGGTQNISGGGYGSVGIMEYGIQAISSGGVGSADTIGGGLTGISAGTGQVMYGEQIIYSGGTGTVDNLIFSDVTNHDGENETVNGRQIISGGVGLAHTINGGFQIIKSGGTGSVDLMSKGGQNINDAVGSITTMQSGEQLIYSGGTGIVATMNGGSQINGGLSYAADEGYLPGGTASIGTMNGGTQLLFSGTTGNISTLNGGTQTISSDAVGTVSAMEGGLQQVLSGGTALNTTLNGGTQLLANSSYADNTTLNANGTIQLNGTTSSTVSVSVGTINANGGNIVLGTGSGSSASAVGNVLNIATLNGSANFVVNTDIAQGNSDKINITSASHSTANTLKINYDPYYNTATSNSSLSGTAQIITAPSDVKFTAAATEWGGLQFTPTLNQNADGSWNLAAITDSVITGASENTKTAADSHQVLDEAWFSTVNSLSKRLGDLRLGRDDSQNGLWARYMRTTNRAGRGRTAELNGNLLQVGYDHAFAVKNGTQYVGLAVDHLNGSSEYTAGSGTAKATSVALYNTWLGNKGHYYDVILRQGHFSNDYHLTDLAGTYSTADYGVNATTLSGEYGYRKLLRSGLYLEPQAEIIYGHLTGTDFTTSTNWPVQVEAANHFLTRLGLAVGKETTKASWYGKVSYYHDFGSAAGITFADYQYSHSALRDWAEITLGGEVQLGRKWHLYGEATKYVGDLTNNVNLNAGLRFSF